MFGKKKKQVEVVEEQLLIDDFDDAEENEIDEEVEALEDVEEESVEQDSVSEEVESEENAETKEESEEAEDEEKSEEAAEVKDEEESEVKDLEEDLDEEGLEDFDEESILVHDEKVEEEEKPKKKGVFRRILKFFGILILVLGIVYLGVTAFFTQFLYYGTTINGTDYSLKRVVDVENAFIAQVEAYELTLHTNDEKEEIIKGSDIGVRYVVDEQVVSILNSQNPFLWPEMFFKTYDYSTVIYVEYDTEALEGVVEGLDCMIEANMTEPINAYPEYADGTYEIVEFQYGTKIDEEAFMTVLDETILAYQSELNMKDTGCYEKAAYTSESQHLIDATKELNELLKGTITYEEGFAIDEDTINSWVTIKDDYTYEIALEDIEEYVAELAKTYNTVGTTRTFTSATGREVKVEGGSFGWTVDQDAEYEQIVADIEGGQPVEREITYSKRGVSHGDTDWGDSYTEIDLSNQKVYYIKDGEVVVEGSIVTGDVDGGHATPQGVYSITYKTKNAVLRGTKYADGTYEYESPVAYWMPFNRGIGMHDASWRGSFGGNIYKTSGSHGCVNMSHSTAQAMYNQVSAGEPVICHY